MACLSCCCSSYCCCAVILPSFLSSPAAYATALPQTPGQPDRFKCRRLCWLPPYSKRTGEEQEGVGREWVAALPPFSSGAWLKACGGQASEGKLLHTPLAWMRHRTKATITARYEKTNYKQTPLTKTSSAMLPTRAPCSQNKDALHLALQAKVALSSRCDHSKMLPTQIFSSAPYGSYWPLLWASPPSSASFLLALF